MTDHGDENGRVEFLVLRADEVYEENGRVEFLDETVLSSRSETDTIFGLRGAMPPIFCPEGGKKFPNLLKRRLRRRFCPFLAFFPKFLGGHAPLAPPQCAPLLRVPFPGRFSVTHTSGPQQ